MLNQSQATVYPVDRKSSRRKRRRVANQTSRNPVARKLEKVTSRSSCKRQPVAKRSTHYAMKIYESWMSTAELN
ncbi:hypothetical protein F511_30125 [Dorcoceras hygrometricum]|uniref:Uncharacterized protein n=1 Tax=Dorcoceras hygrometricum TaxID=472368 RepID=A0A2Z7AAD3_9LAMI|nr:hypothetical protein F511_30125 [Dorcoceras hygrometricum]